MLMISTSEIASPRWSRSSSCRTPSALHTARFDAEQVEAVVRRHRSLTQYRAIQIKKDLVDLS